LKITVSFKEGEKDMYEYLEKQLSASIYLKQLLKNEMEKEPKPVKHDPFSF